MRFLRMPSLYFLFILGIIFLFVPGYSYYRSLSFKTSQPAYRDLPASFQPITAAEYPKRVGEELQASLSAEAVFVIDAASAVPIYEKNTREQLYPASTTKMMTALLSVENYDLQEVVEVPVATFSGSLMKLVPGERITVENLLHGLLINSGNDAADVLADHFSGGKDAFIALMNLRAKELGLQNTHFANPSGLPDPAHVSTAWDLGQLAVYIMQNPVIRSIVRTSDEIVYGVSGEKHVLKSTNQLLGKIQGLDGVKTGYTEEAGEILVSSVMRNNHRIIIVLLKSNDRFGETKKIVDWVFGNYKWESR